MGFFDFFRKKERDAEAKRREFLERNGRICDGLIIDTGTNETGNEVAYYFYSVSGVDYQSSEVLTEEQRQKTADYIPGAKVGIRYDPRNHGNSILV